MILPFVTYATLSICQVGIWMEYSLYEANVVSSIYR
jgi:hypothetical protein